MHMAMRKKKKTKNKTLYRHKFKHEKCSGLEVRVIHFQDMYSGGMLTFVRTLNLELRLEQDTTWKMYSNKVVLVRITVKICVNDRKSGLSYVYAAPLMCALNVYADIVYS